LAQWREVFLTPEQHLGVQKAEIDKQRLAIAENNELLAKIRQPKNAAV
jgi:hypothetical protein